MENMKIAILDKKSEGIKSESNFIDKNRLKNGQRGYIWVKTESLMKGYYKQKTLTKKVSFLAAV